MFSIGLNVIQFLGQPTPICKEPDVDVSCPPAEPNVNLSCPEPHCPEPICPSKDCPEQGLLKQFMSSVSDQYDYEINKYDCTQFANELARRLQNKGFDAETKFITVDCSSSLWNQEQCEDYNGGHRIVEIDDLYLEPTTGDIIDPQNYEDYNLR